MKKFAVGAFVFAALLLFVPSFATAEPTHPCEVGIYMTPDAYGATGAYVDWGPVDVYVVLSKPCDVNNNDEPYTIISAYDFCLTFNPTPNNDLFYMGTDYPDSPIDIGEKDINQGFLEYCVGFDSGVPVADEMALLATIHFFSMTTTTTYVTLGPLYYASIPGQMCFLPGNPPLQVMHSISGSHEAPVFIFNGEAVAVENESFGSVKALYR